MNSTSFAITVTKNSRPAFPNSRFLPGLERSLRDTNRPRLECEIQPEQRRLCDTLSSKRRLPGEICSTNRRRFAHQEYWIPAEELDEFNQNIIGEIEVIAEYRPGCE